MAAKTAAELEAIALTLKPLDSVEVVWGVANTQTRYTWAGTVKTQTPDKKSCKILYAVNSMELDFPPTDADTVVFSVTVKASKNATMASVLATTNAAALQIWDLSSHIPLATDKVGILILIGKWREVARTNTVLDLEHSAKDRQWARETNYFEKENLIRILEAFYLTHMGEKDFHLPPKNMVALAIITRLHAFKTAEVDGGSIYLYMQSVLNEGEPENLQKHAKAAKKGGRGKADE